MGMHDLFGVVDDPVTEAARMLSQHDLFVVPGSVLRECLTVLHVLVCDSDDAEEAMLTQALIHHIEAAWEQATGLKVGAHDTAAMLPNVEFSGGAPLHGAASAGT